MISRLLNRARRLPSGLSAAPGAPTPGATTPHPLPHRVGTLAAALDAAPSGKDADALADALLLEVGSIDAARRALHDARLARAFPGGE